MATKRSPIVQPRVISSSPGFTLDDVESWASEVQATVQFTRRIRHSPVWACRIFKLGDRRLHQIAYFEGYGDSLSGAFEAALEAWGAG